MAKSSMSTLEIKQDVLLETLTVVVSLNWLHPTAEILSPLRAVVDRIAEQCPEFVFTVYDVMGNVHGSITEEQRMQIDNMRARYAMDVDTTG